MIQFSESVWVGNSADWRRAGEFGITAALCVAIDLYERVGGHPITECAQVGLIDGPGNPMSAYCAAVLALDAMLGRHARVLVYCHEGRSRSVVVAMMYLNVSQGRDWDSLRELVCERVDWIPEPHPSHRAAFERMDWVSLKRVVGER